MQKKHPKSDHILQYLCKEDSDLFLNELLRAVDQSQGEGNFDAINLCIEEWEDTVELLSIPGLQDNAWVQFNELREAGAIN